MKEELSRRKLRTGRRRSWKGEGEKPKVDCNFKTSH
jgi:hypothetical protein